MSNPKSKDDPVILLIIDPQVDFHEGGSLAVSSMKLKLYFHITISKIFPLYWYIKIPGATKDAERIAKMINENIDKIDEIYVTMDSHHVSINILVTAVQ